MSDSCERCGAPRRPGAQFCGQCGQVFAAARQETPSLPQARGGSGGQATCPQCGAPRREGARVCGQCGRPFSTAAAQRRPSGPRAQPGTSKGVVIGLAAAVVVVCAGLVGLIALLFKDDKPPLAESTPISVAGPPAGTDELGPEPTPLPLEEVTLSGRVALPAGSALRPADLRLMSNVDDVAVDEGGGFAARALRGEGSSTLAMATNAQGNPVLLRLTRGPDTTGSGEMSAASTARALVLFDYAILLLPPEQVDQAFALLEAHPDLPALIQAVEQAVAADPDRPLDEQAHPELYEQAGQITWELLDRLVAQGAIPRESIAAHPGPSAHLARPLAQDDRGEYVHVEDDEAHTAPSVTLVNASFCYYKVDINRDGEAWKTEYLARNTIFTPFFQWPPALRYTRKIEPGDGKLDFTFSKRKEVTAVDLMLTAFSAVAGVPATQAGRMEHLTNYLVGSTAVTLQLSKSLYTMMASVSGESFYEISKRTMAWTVENSVQIGTIGVAVLMRDSANLSNKAYVSWAFRVLGTKAGWGLLLGYHSVNLGTMTWSMVHAPDEYVESGMQRDGRYPAFRLLLFPAHLESEPIPEGMQFMARLERAEPNLSEVTFQWLFTGPDAGGATQVRQLVASDVQALRQNEDTPEGYFESKIDVAFPAEGYFLVAVQAWNGDQLLGETEAPVEITVVETPQPTPSPEGEQATVQFSVGNIPTGWDGSPSWRSDPIPPDNGWAGMGTFYYSSADPAASSNRFIEQVIGEFRYERRICSGPYAETPCRGYASQEEALAGWDGFNRDVGGLGSRGATFAGLPGWALEQQWTVEQPEEYTSLTYVWHEYVLYGQVESGPYRYLFSARAAVQCLKPAEGNTDEEALAAPGACQQERDNLIDDIAALLGSVQITPVAP